MRPGVSQLGLEHHHYISFDSAPVAFALHQDDNPGAAEDFHFHDNIDLVFACFSLDTTEVLHTNV